MEWKSAHDRTKGFFLHLFYYLFILPAPGLSCSMQDIYLFIYFWLRWVFVAAHELSLVVVSGDYS